MKNTLPFRTLALVLAAASPACDGDPEPSASPDVIADVADAGDDARSGDVEDGLDADIGLPDTGPTWTLVTEPAVPEVFATLAKPSEGLAFDGAGGLWVTEGPTVLRLAGDGTSTVVGSLPAVPDGVADGATGMAVGPDGALYVARYDAGRIDRLPLDGAEPTVFAEGLGHPNALAFAADGTLWFTDSGDFGTETGGVLRIPPGGAPERLVDGVGHANGIALDPARGYVWYASSEPGSLHRLPVDAAGEIGTPELVSDDAVLAVADGLALAPDGSVLVAAFAEGAVYGFTPEGLRLVLHDPDEGRLLGVASLALGAGDGFSPASVYATSLFSPTLFVAPVLEVAP